MPHLGVPGVHPFVGDDDTELTVLDRGGAVSGALNEVFQGMYLPPSKLLFLSRSTPDSFGTLTPGEPLVGAAFQSETIGAAGAAGAAGGGVAGAAGCAGAVVAGVTGGGAAGAHETVAQMASGAAEKRSHAMRPRACRRDSRSLRSSVVKNRHTAGGETLT